ncbi:SDR family NAD(P)-dependent oxidoreductase [Nostoc sp.]|uniref:SDR family NAD(P)-dependent oxidoreductase n=1 Tax=Nostoc sp. TaxID=1180 RepID=UPI002FF5FF87
MKRNKAKIALVTGASQGLGKNTALALAKKGVGVIVTDRSSEAKVNSVVSAIAYGGILLAKVLQTHGQKCYNSKPQLQIEGLSLRNT